MRIGIPVPERAPTASQHLKGCPAASSSRKAVTWRRDEYCAERPRQVACCSRSGVLDAERSSLVAETLEEMEADEDSKKLAQQLQTRGQAALTREERRARQRSLDAHACPSFQALLKALKHSLRIGPAEMLRQLLFMAANLQHQCIPSTFQDMPHTALLKMSLKHAAEDQQHKRQKGCRAARGCWWADFNFTWPGQREGSRASSMSPQQEHGVPPMVRGAAKILQLNIGLYCNQACSHCHVESSPLRQEMMDRATADRCLHLAEQAISQGSLTTLDITGGAPELNSQFRHLASRARALGLEVIDRCNLTVLMEPGQEDLVSFLAEQGIRVVASLPCYSAENVDQQRGRGVFERSIQGLKMLNAAGYGREGSGLILDLVYNPNGIFLAPPQATLQEAYKAELQDLFGISFNSLFCLNNMPIKRYADHLIRQHKLGDYLQLLVDSFNPGAAAGVMCRNTVNISWDGRVYDCDFNQQLEMGIRLPGKPANSVSVFDVESLDELTGLKIATDNHCYGCTAGSGSSCQGQ